MYLQDIETTFILHSVSSTVMFLDNPSDSNQYSVAIDMIISDEGKGYEIRFVTLGLKIRLYKGHPKLNKKPLVKFQDEEIKPILEEILREYIQKMSFEELEHWIIQQRKESAEQKQKEIKNTIRELLF